MSSAFVLDFTERVPIRQFESSLAGTPPLIKPKVANKYL